MASASPGSENCGAAHPKLRSDGSRWVNDYLALMEPGFNNHADVADIACTAARLGVDLIKL
jgi:hypothetical protein